MFVLLRMTAPAVLRRATTVCEPTGALPQSRARIPHCFFQTRSYYPRIRPAGRPIPRHPAAQPRSLVEATNSGPPGRHCLGACLFRGGFRLFVVNQASVLRCSPTRPGHKRSSSPQDPRRRSASSHRRTSKAPAIHSGRIRPNTRIGWRGYDEGEERRLLAVWQRRHRAGGADE